MSLDMIGKLLTRSLLEEPEIRSISELLKTGNRAVILYGPSGTGKTYEAKNLVRIMIAPCYNLDTFEAQYRFSKLFPMSSNPTAAVTPPPPQALDGCYEVVQFHPGYTYETFIGGIQPQLDATRAELRYVLVPGIFKRFCDAARANSPKPFIFIIDEINRAELSAVFGELLYALEYRGETVHIPHFGDFTIPNNVYLIGTMNNVDKSLVTFDLALRRRFGFYALRPNLDLLRVMPRLEDIQNLDTYIQRCEQLNTDIKDQLHLDDEYQIGHAYFMKIRDFLPGPPASSAPDIGDVTEEIAISCLELEKLWAYHLEPLLEEYLGLSAAQQEMQTALRGLRTRFVARLG